MLKKLQEIHIPLSYEQIKKSTDRFYKIENMISQLNKTKDGKLKNARQLAENIEAISIDDIIKLLQAVKYNPDLKNKSCLFSKTNHLFNKIILMVQKESKNPWILKLHSYPVLGKKEGTTLSNLGEKFEDNESFPHFHRWELTSKFLLGGFNNEKFEISNFNSHSSFLTEAYNLVPSIEHTEKKIRKARFEGKKYLKKQASDLYQQGDHVFYPIEDLHRVNTEGAAFLGKTITLILTGESKKNTATFFMPPGKGLRPLDQVYYSDKEHTEAIDTLITDLQLIKLTQELARYFDRFRHPNSLETEVLPTVAMFLLETNFQEKVDPENIIVTIIKKHLVNMNPSSLNELIVNSQFGLLKPGFFVRTIKDLKNKELQEIINKRMVEKQKPNDIYSSDITSTLFPINASNR